MGVLGPVGYIAWQGLCPLIGLSLINGGGGGGGGGLIT